MLTQADLQHLAIKLESKVQKIPECGCWIWEGKTNNHGYGMIHYNNVVFATHRLSYMAFKGPIQNKSFVCHHCDIRTCINPHHLYQSTIYQNNIDAISRDRFGKGAKANKVKLHDEQVLQIKALLAANVAKTEVAKAYGVGVNCIKDIQTETTWGWLKMNEASIGEKSPLKKPKKKVASIRRSAMTFDEIEKCFPEGGFANDDGILVTASWLHDFARNVHMYLLTTTSNAGEAAQGDGWIEWSGGENPAPGKRVNVKYRDGREMMINSPSEPFDWSHGGGVMPAGREIISYRVCHD